MKVSPWLILHGSIFENLLTSYFCAESLIILTAVLLIFTKNAKSWNSDELEVFDAVDEIKKNFYVLLEVSPVSFFFILQFYYDVICKRESAELTKFCKGV